ncbi:hypothetical protein PLICRDRAFT_42283 [Plicaturopsis crispa FD-325 SS-3]|nr:hypothetical protein PLICRDRAFT_42283 [Plicaturopsis crispa FD-325 SS-3]
MASGYGYKGGRSRCFAYWQEFSKCYAETDSPSACRLQADDYLECLHHPQDIARQQAVKAEFLRKAEHQAKEGRKVSESLADGVVVGVGLIQSQKATSDDSAK